VEICHCAACVVDFMMNSSMREQALCQACHQRVVRTGDLGFNHFDEATWFCVAQFPVIEWHAPNILTLYCDFETWTE